MSLSDAIEPADPTVPTPIGPQREGPEHVPALFEHCCTIYKEMLDNAQEMDVQGTKVIVYEGYLTKLFQRLRMSIPYYTQVMDMLKEMKCVHQLRRGGGNSRSQWIMMQPPELETFKAVRGTNSASKTVKGSRTDQLEQAVRDLNRRLGRLEAVVEALLEERETPDGK